MFLPLALSKLFETLKICNASTNAGPIFYQTLFLLPGPSLVLALQIFKVSNSLDNAKDKNILKAL